MYNYALVIISCSSRRHERVACGLTQHVVQLSLTLLTHPCILTLTPVCYAAAARGEHQSVLGEQHRHERDPPGRRNQVRMPAGQVLMRCDAMRVGRRLASALVRAVISATRRSPCR